MSPKSAKYSGTRGMPVLPLSDCGMSELGWVTDGSPRGFQLPVILEKQGRLWSTVYGTVSTLDWSMHPPPARTLSAFLKSSNQCFAEVSCRPSEEHSIFLAPFSHL